MVNKLLTIKLKISERCASAFILISILGNNTNHPTAVLTTVRNPRIAPFQTTVSVSAGLRLCGSVESADWLANLLHFRVPGQSGIETSTGPKAPQNRGNNPFGVEPLTQVPENCTRRAAKQEEKGGPLLLGDGVGFSLERNLRHFAELLGF